MLHHATEVGSSAGFRSFFAWWRCGECTPVACLRQADRLHAVVFRARFAARHVSRSGRFFCVLSRLMSLAYQRGKLRSIRRKILAKFLARYFVVSLKQHYVKRNLSVRISMRPPTWALAVRRLPSAPPALRATAQSVYISDKKTSLLIFSARYFVISIKLRFMFRTAAQKVLLLHKKEAGQSRLLLFVRYRPMP